MEYKYLYIIATSILLLEILIFILVNYFKKNFKWLITKKDEFPFKEQVEIDNFIKSSFSRNLGWDRKPDTSGVESIDHRHTNYRINSNGYRKSNNKYKNILISVFGDSYAFCRYVNDDSTWEHYLEKKIKKQVRNYGVGNYGIDQAFLKYDQTNISIKCKIILIVFVPETISRIYSYWRYYLEFGNKFGFKPIFKLKKKKLIKFDNFLSKYQKINLIKKNLNLVKRNDLFFKTKFEKSIFKFSYLISYIKNFKINSMIFFNLSLFYLFKIFLFNKFFFDKAVSIIIQNNILKAYELYANKEHNKLLLEIIKKYNNKIKKKKKKLVLIVVPQKFDVLFAKKKKLPYEYFFEKLKINYSLLDLTREFVKKKNISQMYLNDKYAGHLSKKGNNFIAMKIHEFLKKESII